MKERILDKIMFRELNFGQVRIRTLDLAFMTCLFGFAFLIRWELMPIESADFWGFLEEWMEQIRAGGGFASLAHEISNYSSPYMYLMCLVSYFTDNDLYGLKMLSVLFDYAAAVAAFLILFHMTREVRKAVMAMAMVLLSPTVILDSAYWCQCDMIYSAFLLYGFYYFLKNNSRKCLIFVGISFAFKQQALFFVPFLILMWLKKKTIRLADFLWIPVLFVAGAVPAWIAGRDLGELLMVYVDQAGTYPWGTLEYPNIYALLGEAMPDLYHAAEVSGAGIFMTLILLGSIAYYIYGKEIALTNELLVTLALFTVAVTVYSLPHMHERYGFFIDLLAILYGAQNGKRLPVTCGFVLVSVLSFMPYLIAVHIVPIQYLAIALLGLIVFVGADLHRQIGSNHLPAPRS